MFTFSEIMMIVIMHFIADFVMQDSEWAEQKSYSLHALLRHTVTYTLSVGVILMMYLKITIGDYDLWDVMGFITLTFLAHTVTDFITSKIVKRLFDKKIFGTTIPNTGGFTVIGLDQVLHYAQLFITYLYVIK